MKPVTQTLTQRLALSGQADARGGFEILAISAGVGNGWVFSPAVLHQSLELWEGVQCFIDHAWTARSVRDLAGVCSNAAWDDSQQGITLNLRPLGPGGALLTALGEQVLREGAAAQVGFSADVMFTAHEQQVQQIVRVLSVDLVVQPARGGAFLRALNAAGIHVDQSINMKET